MSQNKNDFDAFLRQKLASLPDAPASDFDAVAAKMSAKRNKKVGAFLLFSTAIIALFFGLKSFVAIPSLYHPRSAEPKEIAAPIDITKPETNDFKTDLPNTSAAQPVEKMVLTAAQNALVAKPASVKSKLFLVDKDAATENQTIAVAPVEALILEETSSATHEEIHLTETKIFEEKQPEPADVAVAEQKNTTTPTTEVPDFTLAEDVRETDRWSAIVSIYPNFTFREFQINSSKKDFVNRSYESIINESERGGVAINGGVDVRYHLGNNVFLGAGLAFIQTKINGAYNYFITETPQYGNDGSIKNYTPLTNEVAINQGIIQTYQYVQMPLHVSYQPWLNKRLRLIIEGGFSYIRLIHVDGTTVDYQSLALRDLNTMDFNRNLGSFDFKVGAAYYINPKLAMGLEPTMMYFSKSLFKEDSPLYMVPWSVGVNFNLRFTLF